MKGLVKHAEGNTNTPYCTTSNDFPLRREAEQTNGRCKQKSKDGATLCEITFILGDFRKHNNFMILDI